MANPNKSQLYELVANALANKPSEQPVHTNAEIGAVGKNDQKKANSKKGMGNTHIRNVGAFNPNKSYSVHVVNRAVARLA